MGWTVAVVAAAVVAAIVNPRDRVNFALQVDLLLHLQRRSFAGRCLGT